MSELEDKPSNVLQGHFGADAPKRAEWECGCSPPVTIQVSDDDFEATCDVCHQRFRRV